MLTDALEVAEPANRRRYQPSRARSPRTLSGVEIRPIRSEKSTVLTETQVSVPRALNWTVARSVDPPKRT